MGESAENAYRTVESFDPSSAAVNPTTPVASLKQPTDSQGTLDTPVNVVPAELQTRVVLDTPVEARSRENDSGSPELFGGRSQIGVAGNVVRRGIFTIEGPPVTLAALLRRAGGLTNASGNQTRILRRVGPRPNGPEGGPQKCSYCQRLDLTQATEQALATPIHGQEIVIIDGPDDRSLYVAVMPHFILQLPIKTDRPVTARLLLDTLEAFWPNIRGQEIGVFCDEAGRGMNLQTVPDNPELFRSPLRPGDVLYVDGHSLDPSQVRAVAEAIAHLTGLKVRTQQPSPTPSASSAR